MGQASIICSGCVGGVTPRVGWRSGWGGCCGGFRVGSGTPVPATCVPTTAARSADLVRGGGGSPYATVRPCYDVLTYGVRSPTTRGTLVVTPRGTLRARFLGGVVRVGGGAHARGPPPVRRRCSCATGGSLARPRAPEGGAQPASTARATARPACACV